MIPMVPLFMGYIQRSMIQVLDWVLSLKQKVEDSCQVWVSWLSLRNLLIPSIFCLFLKLLKGIFHFLFKGLYHLNKVLFVVDSSASSVFGCSGLVAVEPFGSGTMFFNTLNVFLPRHLPSSSSNLCKQICTSWSDQSSQYLCFRELLRTQGMGGSHVKSELISVYVLEKPDTPTPWC